MRLRIGLLLLAVGASLAFVDTTEARPWGVGDRGYGGGGYYGGYYGYRPYGYSSYGYYGNSYYPYAYDYQTSPYYYSASPNFYGAMPVTPTYQSFYSGPTTTDPSAALINIQVPADADIMIGDSTTQQRGANRSFVSPPLEQGKTYSYDIKARWTQNGQPVEETKRVQIRAGDQVRVDFANAAGVGATGAGWTERGGNANTDPRIRGRERQPAGSIPYNGNGNNGYGTVNPSTVPANNNGTVIDGVFVPGRPNALRPAGVVAPGANANQPAGVNPSNLPPAGTTNQNQFPPAGQNNPNTPNQVPAGQNNPNQVPAGQNNPNQLPAGSNNPNQLPAGQTNPNTPVTPAPGQTAPSPSIVPPKQ